MKVIALIFALVAVVAADVSHLPSNQYLPPQHHYHHAASEAAPQFAPAPVSFQPAAAPAPVEVHHVEAASAPEPAYVAPVAAPAPVQSFQAVASAPAPSFEAAPVAAQQFDFSASESAPAHTFSSADGYRYKTHRRVVYRRHRRGAPSTEYLPPVHAAASVPVPSNDYLPPVHAATNQFETFAPVPAAESAQFETVEASEPAHSFSSADGYRYRTNRRRVYRRRRY